MRLHHLSPATIKQHDWGIGQGIPIRPEKRRQIIALLTEGHKHAAIATMVGVGKTSISRINRSHNIVINYNTDCSIELIGSLKTGGIMIIGVSNNEFVITLAGSTFRKLVNLAGRTWGSFDKATAFHVRKRIDEITNIQGLGEQLIESKMKYVHRLSTNPNNVTVTLRGN
jgi:hypothetical protein